eukprot:COSAG01_NODE_13360_length_1596_cov_1.342017_2_plen_252_part_00
MWTAWSFTTVFLTLGQLWVLTSFVRGQNAASAALGKSTTVYPDNTQGGPGPWPYFAPFLPGHPMLESQPNWEIGTKDSPVVFASWKGVFHDGSGPLGTYDNKMDSYWLIDPCQEDTKQGNPCRILMWFDLFESEYIQDKLVIYDGATVDDPVLAELSGDNPPDRGVPTKTTLFYSMSHQMLLHFISDESRQKQGFTVRYQTDHDATLKTFLGGAPPTPQFLKPLFELPTKANVRTDYSAEVVHETLNTTLR